MSTSSTPANSSTVSVWVLANNAGGEPELLNFKIRVTDDEFSNGDHYDLAVARAKADGYATDRTKAFDESDPAGRLMQRMADMQATAKQEQPAGLTAEEDPDAKVWEVPLTVDMTLSATIQVRAGDRSEAIALAKDFASTSGFGLFSLDEGNFRGARDFYVGDPDGVCELEPEQDGTSADQTAVRPRQG